MKLLITTLFLSIVSFSFSQLDPPSSMFWNNYTAFNPAATGLHYRHQSTVSYRTDFGKTAIDRQTLAASYNAKMKVLGGGIGINYTMDGTASSKQNKVNLNYSYHIALGDNYTLAAGVSAGVINMDTRFTYGSAGGAPVNVTSNETGFTSNLGIMLKSRQLTAGISSTQLNGPVFKESLNSPKRNYHINADYLFAITRKFSLKPQALFTTDMDYARLDLNLTAYINKFWAGATWRLSETAGFMAGYEIKQKFRMGYCIEIGKSRLNNSTNFFTHEFMLSYVIKDRPVIKSLGNPSF